MFSNDDFHAIKLYPDCLIVWILELKDVNILGNPEGYRKNLYIKVRSTGRLIKAKMFIKKEQAEVHLEEEEAGISPGQACVFYHQNKFGDKVLGGGWISKTVNKNLSTWLTVLKIQKIKQPNSDLVFFLNMF